MPNFGVDFLEFFFDPDSIDAYFEYDEVEYNGLMSAYNDALPYGDNLLVTINGKECIIINQYCLLPKCPGFFSQG